MSKLVKYRYEVRFPFHVERLGTRTTGIVRVLEGTELTEVNEIIRDKISWLPSGGVMTFK